jgi:hypothetical protein
MRERWPLLAKVQLRCIRSLPASRGTAVQLVAASRCNMFTPLVLTRTPVAGNPYPGDRQPHGAVGVEAPAGCGIAELALSSRYTSHSHGYRRFSLGRDLPAYCVLRGLLELPGQSTRRRPGL